MIRVGRQVAEPSPTQAGVRLAFDVAVLLRDSLDGYRRLLSEYDDQGSSGDLRAAALQIARKAAAYERLAIISGEDLLSLPEALSPNPGLAVLQHLTYALVQLGQEDPDERTLISESELDQILAQTQAQAWMEGTLEAIPDDWKAT
jgi:MoxR-like ATPase